MLYIIDGYNLMFKVLRAGDDLQKQRTTIIRDLNAKVQLLGVDALLVFDAQYKYGEAQRSHYNYLEIHFTAQGEIADDYIVKYVKGHLDPAKVTVVTSDKKLSWQVRRKGAHTETVDEFLSLLNRRYRNKIKQINEPKPTLIPAEELPPTPPAPKLKDTPEKCFEFYLSQFEKELVDQGVKPETPVKKKKKRLVKPDPAELLSDQERWLRAFNQTPKDDEEVNL